MKNLLVILLLMSCRTWAQDGSFQNKDTVFLNPVDVYGYTLQERFAADSAKLTKELDKMLDRDQKFRKRLSLYKKHYHEQRSIDSNNTIRMMEIIDKYGFPSKARWGKHSELLPHIVLVHAPQNYMDTLKIIVESEYQKGRMTQYEYDHTMWHLNGRKGVPGMDLDLLKQP